MPASCVGNAYWEVSELSLVELFNEFLIVTNETV